MRYELNNECSPPVLPSGTKMLILLAFNGGVGLGCNSWWENHCHICACASVYHILMLSKCVC